MIVHLSDIFFYMNREEFENNINKLLDAYQVDHSGFHLYSDDTSLNISDDEGNHFMGAMLSTTKRSYYPIDTINILTQFYFRRSSKKSGYNWEFIRDCSNIVLVKINLPLFKFEDLYNEDDSPCIKFQLYKNLYKMTIVNQSAGGGKGINILKLYIIIQNEEISIIKSKPLKLYGNPYIDILYQMVLYVHYFVSYIKGNSTWDGV